MTDTKGDSALRRVPELLTALTCLVGGVSIAYGASQIPVAFEGAGMGPRAWPMAMGVGIAVLAILLLLRVALLQPGAADAPKQLPATRHGAVRLLGTLLLLTAYVAIWKFLPFAVSTPVLVAALLLLNGERRWHVVVLVPVAIAAVLIGLFQLLLRVPL